MFRKLISKVHEDPNFYLFGGFLVTGFCLYLNTFGNYWTLDDPFVILQNPDVKSWKGFVDNSYPGRPLRELSFLIDYKLFGFSPAAWHVQNIVWHSLNAWLVFVLSSLLLDSKRVAFFASFLFLVHPIQVEVVAQVSHRKDSLALFFMLSSAIFYLLYRKKEEILYLLAMLFTFFLASLSKENAFVFPIFLVIFEFSWGYKIYGLRALYKKTLFLLFICSVLLIPFFLSYGGYVEKASSLLVSNNYFSGFSFMTYFGAIINSWGYIFPKLILPYDLAVNYVLEVPENLTSPRIIFTLLALAFYISSLIISFRKNSYLFFALLWLGILFLPTSNIVPINHFAADRYMYTPSVGFFMMVSFLANKYLPQRITLTFMALIVVVLSGLTVQQNKVWKDNATLWQHSLNANPDSARAISNVGLLFYGDDNDRNLEMQLRAAGKNPFDPFVQMKIGKIYERKGENLKAMDYYKKALGLFNPRVHGMYKNVYKELKHKTEGT